MRIIFFNIWHGQIWTGLEKFLKEQSSKTDIFCFLEVNPKLEKKLENLLGNFVAIYDKGIKTVYLNGVIDGRGIFVKNGIEVEKSEKQSLFRVYPTDVGGFLYAKLNIRGKVLFLGEVHGKASPGTKMDTSVRIKQSEKIINFFNNKKGPKIIGGDFNLNPDTKSVALFEETGYRNLIKDFKIKSTRNNISWENFKDVPGFVKQYFADYVFVSPDVKVKNFEVPYIEVSDHLPQILDFEI
jgi:hypothetical protein